MTGESDALLVVFVTTPTDRATDLAKQLVDARLCACVNIVPEVRSVYRWKGQMTTDTESLLVTKTTDQAFAALKRAVVASHAYEVPEIIALPVVAEHAAYGAWVRESVKGEGPQ